MDWNIDVIARLLAATLLGALIGWERETMNRSAGLRTHMLVSLGSALFTILSLTAFREIGKVNDPARLAAQVVSGIGFLGAGTILKHGATVRGLTSAATMWVVAAIGMAAGAACYVGALATTLISLITLITLRSVEHEISVHHYLHIEAELAQRTQQLNALDKLFNDLNISTLQLDLHSDGTTTKVNATVYVPDNITPLNLMQMLEGIGLHNAEVSS
ncbi:MgtC/SapB family protein [bacterium]|nr:MgtC/SapB family protein [bacterium]